MGACLTLHKYDNKYNEFNQTNFLAAHFAKRNTKFGGGGKIGIGKRGRAKIPSPQPQYERKYSTGVFVFLVECAETRWHYLP